MTMPDQCPWCWSPAVAGDTDQWTCGSQQGPTKVYRSPGCYEIREGRLDDFLLRLQSMPHIDQHIHGDLDLCDDYVALLKVWC